MPKKVFWHPQEFSAPANQILVDNNCPPPLFTEWWSPQKSRRFLRAPKNSSWRETTPILILVMSSWCLSLFNLLALKGTHCTSVQAPTPQSFVGLGLKAPGEIWTRGLLLSRIAVYSSLRAAESRRLEEWAQRTYEAIAPPGWATGAINDFFLVIIRF